MSHPERKCNRISRRAKIIPVISVFFFLSLCLTYYFFVGNKQAHSFKKDTSYSIRGVDLSHHNPIIDWGELQDQHISFVYLKSTGGISLKDRNYIYNYESAKRKDIKTGSYHFYLFGVSGKEQASHFIKNARCEKGDLIPAIDVEHSPSNPYSTDTSYIRLVVEELKILENELYEYYGAKPLLYTNRDCYKLYIQNNFPDNLLWICDLKKAPDDIPNWIIWQFSHEGELPGIEGKIDLNYFRYDNYGLQKILIP